MAAGEQPDIIPPPATPEVDPEVDSALGEDNATDTTSLTSSILRNREEWGRTYHKFRGGENDYWGPDDDQQQDQLDIGHHMLTLLLDNQLYLAPIDPKTCRRALDVGCGTGIWSLDFADAHTSAEVTGIDLSPIQPSWIPPNCHFVIDDVEEPWTFPLDYFDFVHIRCLMGSVSNWPELYKQAYRHLTPGGWIQHLDMDIYFTSDDGTVDDSHMMAQWSKTFIDCGEMTGKTFKVANRSAQWMHDVGFEDIRQRWYKTPVGPWPKDQRMKQVGVANYHYCLQGCEGWALFLLTKVLQWRGEEVQVFIAKFRNELNNRKNHAYYNIGVTWARKPMQTKSTSGP